MPADAAVAILDELTDSGVDPCVGGGWAVDALLGEQTRPHRDLDLWMPATSLEHVIDAFVRMGIDRLYPWGDDRPWNFVVHDGEFRRIDLHLYEPLADGSFHYGGFETGEIFPDEALAGVGSIGGRTVRCEAAAWSLRWHSGYPARRHDREDMRRLCSRFGFDLPAALS